MNDPLLQNQIYRIQYLLPDSSDNVALALIFHDMSSIHSRQLHDQKLTTETQEQGLKYVQSQQ